MTMKIEDHAANVVTRFKEMLTEEQIAAVGDEHFDELSMLIEAAIGSTESKALLEAVEQVKQLANDLAKNVASIDHLES